MMMRTRKQTFFFLTFLLALLTGCVDDGIEDNGANSQPVAMDPGKGFTERRVSVNRDGKDGGQVALRYYDDMPNVAYIAASAYYKMMLPEATMTVDNKGNYYQLKTADATATVDVKGDMMTSESYNDFVSLTSLTGPGLPSFDTCFNPYLKYDSHQYDRVSSTVTLNFRKYGIDLRDDGRDAYFPFATINDIFADNNMHMACFNGNKILVNTDNDKDFGDLDPDFSVSAFKTVEVGKDLATYRYAELCFVIDNLFGYPDRTLLEKQGLRQQGIDVLLNAVSGGKETKELLQSANQAMFALGTDALGYLLYDGGHTIIGVRAFIPQSVRNDFWERCNEANKKIPEGANELIKKLTNIQIEESERRNKLRTIRKKNYDTDLYQKSKDGRTAVFVMNSFMDLNTQGWRTYYASNHTEADWQKLVDTEEKDLVVQTVEALKRARKEGVKNLVLDLTLNEGGEDDPTTAIVALLGDKTGSQQSPRKTSSWDMNILTGQFLTKTFAVDRNFDGKFDELDDKQDWTGDMNIVVLVSDCTFSNGNVFAAKMKDYGYQIWGQKSGGGACSVQYLVMPDGMEYRISSYRSHSTDRNKQSIDGGIAVDKTLSDEQMYDIEYLNSLFK